MDATRIVVIGGYAVTTRISHSDDDFWVTIVSRKRLADTGKWVVADQFEIPFPLNTRVDAESHAEHVLSSIDGISDDGKPAYRSIKSDVGNRRLRIVRD